MLKIEEKRESDLMEYGDFKITIYDFEAKTVKIKSEWAKMDIITSFDNFEGFVKYIYSCYKKYKYVFEKGKNEREEKR